MKLLREPLLHFLAIGAALFGTFYVVDGRNGATGEEIVVSSGRIASIAAIFRQTWQRSPTSAELDALVNEHVRDEVLYRQGVAMGLDKDDAVVRRRVRQKMEFVADMVADVEPTDAELKSFVAEHPEWFREEPLFSFEQVYFGDAGVPGPDALELLLKGLNGGTIHASNAGRPFMVGGEFRELPRSSVAQTFGEEFAASIDKATPGEWNGPIASAYGAHLVRVTGRIEAREPPFDHVRNAARREWLHIRKVAADEALYQELRSRYVIKVEAVPSSTVDARQAGAAP